MSQRYDQTPAPRPATLADLPALIAEANRIFGAPIGRQPSLLFHPRNVGNLWVIADEGQILSHAGFLPRQVVSHGCHLSIACFGAVFTHEEWRGRGLAGAVLDRAIEA